MECITTAKMKELEAKNASLGLTYGEMMDHAGRHAAQVVLDRYAPVGKRVLALCGRGNNGGDGLVSALALARAGAAVAAALPLGEPATPQAKEALARLEEYGAVPVTTQPEEIFRAIAGADLILDCLFGTGFGGEVSPQVRRLMEAVDHSGARVVSYDVPSGVEADTGRYDCCIHSHLTIAFQALKPAHLTHWRGEYQGEVTVVPIGTPPEALSGFDGMLPVLDRAYFASHRPRRSATGHKGSNGTLTVVAGSREYRGAAALACQAALRAGVGYVRLVSVEEVCALTLARTPEVVCTVCPQTPDGALSPKGRDRILAAVEQADAVLLGCGLGRGPGTAEVVGEVLRAAAVPVVADADALNTLSQNLTLFKETKAPLILTPHPGEFSRLFGPHIHEVVHNPVHWAQTIAKEYAVTLLLKGPYSVVCDPEGRAMASFLGSSGLARAGSGDALAGLVGAMAARGLSPMEAAACGLYLHGRCAELAAEAWTQESMLPSDLCAMLPQVFREV